MTYEDIINLPPIAYAKYLLQQDRQNIADIDVENLSSIESSTVLANKLIAISNTYSMVNALLMIIIPLKRQANRDGDKETYQDLIDKENITEDILKVLDLKYKAINRSLTVRDSNLKELYMLKDIP